MMEMLTLLIQLAVLVYIDIYVSPKLVLLLCPIRNLGPSRVTKVMYNSGISDAVNFVYNEEIFKYIPMSIRYVVEAEGDGSRSISPDPIYVLDCNRKHVIPTYHGKLDVVHTNMYAGYGKTSENYDEVYSYSRYYLILWYFLPGSLLWLAMRLLCIYGIVSW